MSTYEHHLKGLSMYNLIEYTSLMGLLYCIDKLDPLSKVAINPTEHYPILYTSLTLDEIVDEVSSMVNTFADQAKTHFIPPSGKSYAQSIELTGGLPIDEIIRSIRSDYAVAKDSLNKAKLKNKTNAIFGNKFQLSFLKDVGEIPSEEFEIALLQSARRYIECAGVAIDSVFSRRSRKDMPSDMDHRELVYTSPVLSLLTLLGISLFDSVPSSNYQFSIPGSIFHGDKLKLIRYPQWIEPVSINTLRTLIKVADYENLHKFSLLSGYYEVIYLEIGGQERPDNAVFIAA